MESYNPDNVPEPGEWLAMDEGVRIALIEEYHEAEGVDLPSPTMHAAIHATVENQLALGIAEVDDAMNRMLNEGLDRHDALHAIGSVLAEHMYNLLKKGASGDDPHAAYHAALKELTAKKWMSS